MSRVGVLDGIVYYFDLVKKLVLLVSALAGIALAEHVLFVGDRLPVVLSGTIRVTLRWHLGEGLLDPANRWVRLALDSALRVHVA